MLESTHKSETVNQLNSFLRGELSAVETYHQAIEKLEDFPERALLRECERSHADRAQTLAMEIRRRGGEPAEGSGIWGTFANLVEGSAALLGAKAAIAALEEGEDHGRDDYQKDREKLDISARTIIDMEILPEQLRTHRTLSDLKKRFS